MYYIYRTLFVSDSLSSVWGHLVHFAKFTMLRFSKATAPPAFIQLQPNVMDGSDGSTRLLPAASALRLDPNP